MCQHILLTLGRMSEYDRKDEIIVELAVDSYSEEDGDDDESRREWLSQYITPLSRRRRGRPRPEARTAAFPPPDDEQSSRGRDIPLWARPGAIGISSTACTASTTLWPCLRHLRRESCRYALAAISQAPAKTERYKSMPRYVAVTKANCQVNCAQRRVTHSPLNPLLCVWRGCAEVGESRHPFFDLHPTVYHKEYHRMHNSAHAPSHPVINIGVRVHVENGCSYVGEGPGFQVERLDEHRESKFRGDKSPRMVRSLGVPSRKWLGHQFGGKDRMLATSCLPHA